VPVPSRALAALAMGAILVGCAGGGGGRDGGAGGSLADGDTLYARLGGMDGVRALVDDLAGRVAADERIQRFFADTDFRRFKARLVVQLCAISGGPCRAGGRSMAEVHRGRGIRPPHFAAFIEDVEAALVAARVQPRDRARLIQRLRRMEPEITR
jgi:hemoglobin